HDVTVQFLNDAWDGTPSTDRNLYLDGASYDGVDANVQHALMSAGSFDFNVSDPTGTPATAGTTPAPTNTTTRPDNVSTPTSTPTTPGTTTVIGSGQSDHLLGQGNWGGGNHDMAMPF